MRGPSPLHEYGARVPQDVAVIGFDDVEGGRFSVPALSTVAPDKEAVALLLRRIEEATRPEARPDGAVGAVGAVGGGPGSADPQDRVVAHRLVLRESTEGAAARDGTW
ncbi:hypothetical protein DT87_26215 [Streptomyces sp. NTK 937]|nr:hypothetical protein DT87_26215 [Streptomyces sp. NTK 937]